MSSTGVFAGRATELVAVDAAMRTPGRALVVSGAAGIGKSRLVAEAAARLRADGAVVLVGQCLPLTSAVPLLPLLDLLRDLRAVDGGRLWVEATARCSPSTRNQLNRLLPEGDPFDPDHEPWAGWQRARMFAAVHQFFRVVAEVGPWVVLVVEDVHWADPLTGDLVTYLVAPTHPSPLTMVLTLRTDEATSPHTLDWRERLHEIASLTTLDLRPLDVAATATQVRDLAGEDVADTDVLRVFERSEGNPFFTEQLLEAALDQSLAPGAADLPRLLRQALLARLSGVSPTARDVLLCLAVAPSGVEGEVLAVCCRSTVGDIRSALRELMARRVLDDRGSGGHHRLGHALLVEALAHDLMPDELVEWHGRMALALAGGAGADEAGTIAEHCRAGRLSSLELTWRLAAAVRAEELFAATEATAQWARAVELVEADPMIGHPDGMTASAIYAAAARAAKRSGDTGLAATLAATGLRTLPPEGAVLERARLLASLGYHQCRDELTTGRAALREAVSLYELVPTDVGYLEAAYDLWFYSQTPDERAEAAMTLDRALAAAPTMQAPLQHQKLLGARAWADLANGDVDSALHHAREGTLLLDRQEDPEAPLLWAINHTELLLKLGRMEEVPGVASSALAGWEAAGSGETEISSILRANVFQAWVALGTPDPGAALLDRVTGGSPSTETWQAYAARAHRELLRGNLEESRRRWSELPRLDHHSADSEIEPWRVETLLWSGESDRALDLAMLLLRSQALVGDPRLTGALLVHAVRAHADLQRSSPLQLTVETEVGTELKSIHDAMTQDPLVDGPLRPVGAADDLLWRAEWGRAQGADDPLLWDRAARLYESRSRPHPAGYARYRQSQSLLSREGRSSDAAHALQEATRLSATHAPMLREVHRLAARVRLPTAAVPRTAAPSPFGLTAREIDVLRLVAGGDTNRQIGSALFISARTVDVHVSRILEKLGARSRLQAAFLAQEAGLLADE